MDYLLPVVGHTNKGAAVVSPTVTPKPSSSSPRTSLLPPYIHPRNNHKDMPQLPSVFELMVTTQQQPASHPGHKSPVAPGNDPRTPEVNSLPRLEQYPVSAPPPTTSPSDHILPAPHANLHHRRLEPSTDYFSLPSSRKTGPQVAPTQHYPHQSRSSISSSIELLSRNPSASLVTTGSYNTSPNFGPAMVLPRLIPAHAPHGGGANNVPSPHMGSYPGSGHPGSGHPGSGHPGSHNTAPHNTTYVATAMYPTYPPPPPNGPPVDYGGAAPQMAHPHFPPSGPYPPPPYPQYYFGAPPFQDNSTKIWGAPPPPLHVLGSFDENNALINRRRIIKRRTRTGCLTCRKRRIKCDERKPHCFNCERSKKVCLGYECTNQKTKKRDHESDSKLEETTPLPNSEQGSKSHRVSVHDLTN